MNLLNNTMKALSLAVFTMLVTACGSGTSKSSNKQSTPPPANENPQNDLAPVVLDSENYTEVSSQALKSLLLNEAGSNALNKSVVITTDRINPFSQDSVTGIVVTISPFPCSNSGTIKGSFSLNNADGSLILDPSRDLIGTLSAEFAGCNHGGFGLDGNVSGTLNGNISKNNFKTSLKVPSLAVEQPNFPSFVFNGDFSYEASSTDYVSVRIDIESHHSLYFADDAYQQFDLTMSKVVNNSTGEYSYEMTSEFTDSKYPQAYISYQTLAPLKGKGFSLPTEGELAIFGENGTVYVYPQEEGALLLELDLDDDGTIDDSYTTTWQDLVLRPLQAQ